MCRDSDQSKLLDSTQAYGIERGNKLAGKRRGEVQGGHGDMRYR